MMEELPRSSPTIQGRHLTRTFGEGEVKATALDGAKAGFARVDFTRLSGGIVAIHSGWKL